MTRVEADGVMRGVSNMMHKLGLFWDYILVCPLLSAQASNIAVVIRTHV
jgi:hypothetical protein